MTQHTHLLLPVLTYTRTDYTALRAFCLKIPLNVIATRYYSADSPQLTTGLESFLLTMRANLIERAIEHNPILAHSLQHARQGGSITTAALAILVQAADIPAAQPQPEQRLSQWLRPRTVMALRSAHLHTLAELVQWIHRRGPGWWRSLPRIGAKRAAVLVAWLQQHAGTLKFSALHLNANLISLSCVELHPQYPEQLAPLGHFTVAAHLDGSEGINRNQHFCFIQAKNDLQAIEFYLSKVIDQPHTYRAYRKELERFLLWAIMVAKKPMSSLLVDDCEAYKHFLQSPSPFFIGPKAPRFSTRWKPFTPVPLSAASQKHALVIIRAAFTFFVGVRYLGGNPWLAVNDPSVTREVNLLQIEKALPETLWQKLITQLALPTPNNRQKRTALAAILLLGDSGLRREEAASARRCHLTLTSWSAHVAILRVLGKRNQRRDVPVSLRTITALRTHWQDRGLDFDHDSYQDVPLLAPLQIPGHAAAQQRHGSVLTKIDAGYTADGLYRLLRQQLRLLCNKHAEAFSTDELHHLATITPHAFRHTFGTLAVASGMPIDVAQAVLGHASPGTTGIYVQAKKQRIIAEAAQYFTRHNENDATG